MAASSSRQPSRSCQRKNRRSNSGGCDRRSRQRPQSKYRLRRAARSRHFAYLGQSVFRTDPPLNVFDGALILLLFPQAAYSLRSACPRLPVRPVIFFQLPSRLFRLGPASLPRPAHNALQAARSGPPSVLISSLTLRPPGHLMIPRRASP